MDDFCSLLYLIWNGLIAKIVLRVTTLQAKWNSLTFPWLFQYGREWTNEILKALSRGALLWGRAAKWWKAWSLERCPSPSKGGPGVTPGKHFENLYANMYNLSEIWICHGCWQYGIIMISLTFLWLKQIPRLFQVFQKSGPPMYSVKLTYFLKVTNLKR